MDPDRTPEQRKEHNKLLEEMRARRNNGEQVFLAQGKIKVRRQHFAREDNGAANVTSKVKDNGSNKVSENHKEDVAQRSGADTKHETNQLDDQQAEDKQPVADAQQQNVVLVFMSGITLPVTSLSILLWLILRINPKYLLCLINLT